jgi:hypothetical protein
MPQTIARIYRNQPAAAEAVNELRERGFNAEAIGARPQPEPTEQTGATAEATPDATMEQILKAGVPREHARVYAEGVSRGEVLVVVIDPLFGTAATAIAILDSHDPLAVELPAAGPSPTTAAPAGSTDWYSAAPLSSWLGWKVLLDDPAPLSTFLNQPVLKQEPAPSTTLDGIRRQSADATPLSGKIGMSVLSDDPAPLSRMLGWQLLSQVAAPLSQRAGWKLLSDDPALLSTKLGWRTLLHNPTPLSSLLGWRTLSKN